MKWTKTDNTQNYKVFPPICFYFHLKVDSNDWHYTLLCCSDTTAMCVIVWSKTPLIFWITSMAKSVRMFLFIQLKKIEFDYLLFSFSVIFTVHYVNVFIF